MLSCSSFSMKTRQSTSHWSASDWPASHWSASDWPASHWSIKFKMYLIQNQIPGLAISIVKYKIDKI